MRYAMYRKKVCDDSSLMGTQFPGADPGGTWEGRRGNAKCSLNNPKQLSAQPTMITYLSFHTGLANTSYINLKAKDDAKVL